MCHASNFKLFAYPLIADYKLSILPETELMKGYLSSLTLGVHFMKWFPIQRWSTT